jgi:hypothetical protein
MKKPKGWKKKCALVTGLLLCASPAFAQVITRGPVPAGATMSFNAPSNVTTVTQALTFEPRLYRSGTPLTALTQVTCQLVSNPTRIACVAPISASNLDAINQVGAHSLTLSLYRQDVGEGPQSLPFSLTTPAGAPTAFQIIQ